ncbi:MAG: rod shape-determining protein MreC [Phycisphaerales bacterium]|nr:MAG: rod shape-determining protein MreC [Phycisphaerales bacterium]
MTGMAGRRVNVSRRMLFTWFVLAGFILLLAPEGLTGEMQLTFARIFCRPASLLIKASLAPPSTEPLADVVSRRRYDRLHNRLANVTQWLRREREKVETLSGLRDRPVWKGVDFVLADIIQSTIDALHGRLIINRGSEDGLAKKQFVMASDSVIGVISGISARTARVMLLTDPSSRIPVTIGELNVSVIMQGRGNDSAGISLLPRKHNVNMGDIVYAQKKPGLLGTAVIVGAVSRCRQDPQNPLLWDIDVKPACRTRKLAEVTVVVMNP